MDTYAKIYHAGEWQWQEGEYTVTRSHQWSAPGCHNSCGILLYTRNDRLEKVEGDPLNPFNQGKLCMRCLNLAEAVNHPDRLKYPLVRSGARGENKWKRISWEQALDLIEEKVNAIKRDFGGEAIVGVHGTGRNINWQLPYFYFGAFDTPNIATLFFTGFSCYLPRIIGGVANNGEFPVVDAAMGHEDRYQHKEWQPPAVVVIWGNEPLKSNADGFLGHWLVKCVQLGTELISVDPRLTWWGARARYWLRLRPGTDGAMAMGWLNVIIQEGLYDREFVETWCDGFAELQHRAANYPLDRVADICDVPAQKIHDAAVYFATHSPGAIQWGLALDQQVDSMSAITAIADIYSICGNIDNPGGMVQFRHAFNVRGGYGTGQENLSPGQIQKRLDLNYVGKNNFMLNCAATDSILRAMETGEPYPIKMLWIQSSNPLACAGMDTERSYKAMQKMDFIVVADPFLTPTASACADLVLPVAMGPERNSVRAWWTPLRCHNKAYQYYEAKSDEELLLYVGKRLNPKAFPFETEIEFLEWFLNQNGQYGHSFAELRQANYAYSDHDSTYYKHEKGLLRKDGQPGFETPSGKVELIPNLYAWGGMEPLEDFVEPPESPLSTPELYHELPLILTTGGRSYEFFHSEHRQLPTMRQFHPEPLVTLHPDTATQYGISQGDWVWIENKRGRCRQRAQLFPGIAPGTVHVEHGWWYPEQDGSADGGFFGTFDSNCNILTTQGIVGSSGIGAPIKGLLCRIYKEIPGENDQPLPGEQVVKRGGFARDDI